VESKHELGKERKQQSGTRENEGRSKARGGKTRAGETGTQEEEKERVQERAHAKAIEKHAELQGGRSARHTYTNQCADQKNMKVH